VTLRFEVFKGAEIKPYIRTLSEMRLEEFRLFPYLYVGNLEDDLAYTHIFPSTPQGRLVVAFQGNQVVGVCSGIPFESPLSFLEEWGETFRTKNIKTNECYFCGELVVAPALRKTDLSLHLMNRFIQETETMKFLKLIFITSIRPADHPLWAPTNFDEEKIIAECGFEKTSLVLPSTWPTLQVDGTVKVEENLLACWIKNLAI
jgi:hypothetical protein